MSGRDGDGRARNDRHRPDSLRSHDQDKRPLGTPWLPLRRAQRVRFPSLLEPISRVELPVLACMFAERRVPFASSGSEVADPHPPPICRCDPDMETTSRWPSLRLAKVKVRSPQSSQPLLPGVPELAPWPWSVKW